MAPTHESDRAHDHHDHEPGVHGHGGAHHHQVDPHNHGRAFVVAIVLNAGFVAIEFIYGFIANSTALMADAGHNLSDVLGLLLAWGAAILVRRAPSQRFTYGLRSSSILAALANAMFLLIASGAIAWEAIQRLVQTPEVAGLTVTVVAGIGVVINGFSAWLFVKGSKQDLNIRGAYLHMAADAAISLGVAVAGIVMMLTGFDWLDSVVSLAVVVVIVVATWGLLRDSVQLALSAVPAHIDFADVETYLRQCEGVTDVHDLHIWGMSTTESAMTVHLVMPEGYPGDVFLDTIMCELKDRFSIGHSTLQVEQGTTRHACVLNADSLIE
ncbi:MAG: cation diffusion facilitator family transporter [Paralcaligenes sp.]